MARDAGAMQPCCKGSPRTRGDGPPWCAALCLQAPVLPAHAGMARYAGAVFMLGEEFSPHTRGWPAAAPPPAIDWAVLPAHAGMARIACGLTGAGLGFSPHTRGWPAQTSGLSLVGWEFSPHTRGWPALDRRRPVAPPRSPRTRGDGPTAGPLGEPSLWFSPHTRGWPEPQVLGLPACH